MKLQYDISVVGREKVRAALNGIEADVLASNRRTISRANSVRRGPARAGAQNVQKAEESAKTAEALRGERARGRDHERAEKEKTRISEREARKRESAAASLQRQRSSALMREHRMEESIRQRSALDTRRNIKGVLGGTAGRLASVGKAGVAMAGLGAGALFATATHGAMAKSASAAELANQLLGNGATQASLTAKRNEVLSTVGATKGFAAQDVIAGMSRFQGVAGEGDATMKMAPVLTQTALATGAEMGDLGDMYASMYAAIRNSAGGSKKSVDEIIAEVEELGRVFGAMGQVGAIEIKDVAAVGSEITAAAMSYEGNIKDNIQKVGAMMQIAKQTGGAGGMGGAEASTAVQNFANDLVQKKDEADKYLQQTGGKDASIFADKSRTKLKSLDKLIPELMAATGGDLAKMGDVLNIRGTRGLKGFTEPYQEAYQAAKKGGASDKVAREAGKTAVSKRLGQFSGIEMSKDEVAEKANFRLAESDKQLEEQMRSLSASIGKELLPVVRELIPGIAGLVPLMTDAARAFGTLVRVLNDSPLTGLAGLIGLAFAVELGKAQIGALISTALAKGSLGGAAAGIGGAGALGVIAIGAASFAITNAVLEIAHQSSVRRGQAGGETVNKTAEDYRGKRAEIMAGPGTAEEKAAAIQALASPALATTTAVQRETSSSIKAVATEAPAMANSMSAGMYGSQSGGEGLLNLIKSIFQSGTEESANKGATALQGEILRDLATATNKLAAAVPTVSINTTNQPSAVKNP